MFERLYWTTDWNQECGAGGAGTTGFYESTADCSSAPDMWVGKSRKKGSTISYDGADCWFDVRTVRTSVTIG